MGRVGRRLSQDFEGVSPGLQTFQAFLWFFGKAEAQGSGQNSALQFSPPHLNAEAIPPQRPESNHRSGKANAEYINIMASPFT